MRTVADEQSSPLQQYYKLKSELGLATGKRETLCDRFALRLTADEHKLLFERKDSSAFSLRMI